MARSEETKVAAIHAAAAITGAVVAKANLNWFIERAEGSSELDKFTASGRAIGVFAGNLAREMLERVSADET